MDEQNTQKKKQKQNTKNKIDKKKKEEMEWRCGYKVT